MVNRFTYRLLNKLARFFKGSAYTVDPALPISAIISYSLCRGAALLRCVLRGVRFSLNPTKLVFIGPQVVLKNRKQISLGNSVTLGRGVSIDGLSIDGVQIGDEVTIGQFTIVEATGVLTNIGKGFCIGANSGLGAFSFVGAAGGVAIGKNVIIGQRASFHSENHVFASIKVPIRYQGVTRQGIRIADDCWIGANVVFLDGANVGRGCVVAAGAVLRGDVPPYSIAAGIPAKVIGSRKNV